MRNRHIYIFTTYLLHRYCPDRFLTMGLKTRLNWLAKTALSLCFELTFQYPSCRNEPIIVCAFIQEVLTKMSISIFRRNFVLRRI